MIRLRIGRAFSEAYNEKSDVQAILGALLVRVTPCVDFHAFRATRINEEEVPVGLLLRADEIASAWMTDLHMKRSLKSKTHIVKSYALY
jgi:hypothetical protein